MKSCKVVITGAFNTGKSAFIQAASDIAVVSTEKRITDALSQVKETTTVALDYGQTTVEGWRFHLYGTPGQPRFEFMWDILARDGDALLVLVDSTDRSTLTLARQLLRRLARRRMPYLVVATKQDGHRPMPLPEIARALGVSSRQVVACDPRQRASTHAVLAHLARLLG
ncbi:MAG: ATP/GTP-binding protein [Anaerolineae bacterium]|nr:ATP/GTP-binding protein [Anaerolineae bacterium]MDW8067867.1 ATP/GTP-binding protein [Anaerolineae bacterium]